MPGTGETSIKSYVFFLEIVAQATYVLDDGHEFIDQITGTPFTSDTLQILFDAVPARELHYSFDGVNDHGHLTGGEQWERERTRAKKIWFRSDTGIETLRFWAW